MRTASGHQCKLKMSGSEKRVNDKTYDISSIQRLTKTFLEVLRCGRAKQRQRNVKKLVCCTCKVGGGGGGGSPLPFSKGVKPYERSYRGNTIEPHIHMETHRNITKCTLPLRP